MSNHSLNTTPVQPPSEDVIPRHTDHQPGAPKAERPAISGLGTKFFYERYGILENPFGVTPNPRYLYQSKTHGEARASLIIGIECGIGFQALIAPPGMGKTTILLHVLERFKDVARTALLFQIHGDSHDFLRYLLSELGSDAPDSSVGRLQEAINQLLVRELRFGRRTIIIIDEAQGLDTPVLETIRLLSNFETRSEKLLQIILAGQPQLAQRLASPEMAQLRQRISILTKLIPFGLEDTINYIENRLVIAGYKGPPLFTSAALRLVWERSRGIPREINTLCFNALLLARAAEQKQVDPAILQEVVADLDLDRIRFNTGTPPSAMRGVQTTNGLSLGNAAEDPPATCIDQTCKAAVSGAKAEADDVSTRPTALDGVDLVQLGTIAAEEVPPFTPEALDVPGANDAATRMHQKQPFLTNRRWIAAITTLGIVSLFTLGLIIRSPGKKNFELRSVSRTEAPHKLKTATKVVQGLTDKHHPTQSPGQQRTGGAQGARSSFRMRRQDQRTVNSTAPQTTPESSARENVVNENPAPGTAVNKSSGKLPNVDKVPNTEDKADSVSENVSSSVPAAAVDSRAVFIANIVPARLIHTVKPIYPPAATEAKIEGSVVLQILVGRDGAVRDVQFISGPPVLVPAAIDALEHWRYQPSYLNGQPLESEEQVTVNFSLR